MSTDIDIYRDDDICFSATCGSWGARLHVGEPIEPGATKRAFGKYGAKLLTLDELDNMITKLQSIRESFVDSPED